MDRKQTSSLWTLLRLSVRLIIVSWSTSSTSTAAKGKSADGSLTSWIIEGKQWWSAVPVPSLSASSLVYHKGASGWDPACSSFTSMTFLTPWQPKLGSLWMTQPHTKWWPAPMTRPNYEPSTSLLSGRNDGIWPFTQGNAPHCQWLAAGNPWDTSTNYMDRYWRLSALPSTWVLPSAGTWTGASTSTTCAQSQQDPRLPQEKPEDQLQED